MSLLPRRTAIVVFLAFAFAYFFSALLRAITATLSPVLTLEFGLNARDLGLLAGGYFLGFSMTQLPMGAWLDRHGPRKVILSLLSVAVLGCLAFSLAGGFAALLGARVLIGAGVSACLMAPLTGNRRWLDASTQLRANSWMLMTGSLGMVASTLPVQWLMPLVGWRPLFWGLAAALVLAMVWIASVVPAWAIAPAGGAAPGAEASYAAVWRNPYFRRMTPIGFFSYGGLIAVQTLWAVPWMIKVAGYSSAQAATGLFWINVCMLCTFWTWGLVNPSLVRRGFSAERLIAWGLPSSFILLAIIVIAGVCLVLHELQLRFAGAAGGGHGVSAGAGGTGPVGLQPGDLCRRVCRPVGHRPADRCLQGPGRGRAGGLPGGGQRVSGLLRDILCLFPLGETP
jgi:MFS family permease